MPPKRRSRSLSTGARARPDMSAVLPRKPPKVTISTNYTPLDAVDSGSASAGTSLYLHPAGAGASSSAGSGGSRGSGGGGSHGPGGGGGGGWGGWGGWGGGWGWRGFGGFGGSGRGGGVFRPSSLGGDEEEEREAPAGGGRSRSNPRLRPVGGVRRVNPRSRSVGVGRGPVGLRLHRPMHRRGGRNPQPGSRGLGGRGGDDHDYRRAYEILDQGMSSALSAIPQGPQRGGDELDYRRAHEILGQGVSAALSTIAQGPQGGVPGVERRSVGVGTPRGSRHGSRHSSSDSNPPGGGRRRGSVGSDRFPRERESVDSSELRKRLAGVLPMRAGRGHNTPRGTPGTPGTPSSVGSEERRAIDEDMRARLAALLGRPVRGNTPGRAPGGAPGNRSVGVGPSRPPSRRGSIERDAKLLADLADLEAQTPYVPYNGPQAGRIARDRAAHEALEQMPDPLFAPGGGLGVQYPEMDDEAQAELDRLRYEWANREADRLRGVLPQAQATPLPPADAVAGGKARKSLRVGDRVQKEKGRGPRERERDSSRRRARRQREGERARDEVMLRQAADAGSARRKAREAARREAEAKEVADRQAAAEEIQRKRRSAERRKEAFELAMRGRGALAMPLPNDDEILDDLPGGNAAPGIPVGDAEMDGADGEGELAALQERLDQEMQAVDADPAAIDDLRREIRLVNGLIRKRRGDKGRGKGRRLGIKKEREMKKESAERKSAERRKRQRAAEEQQMAARAAEEERQRLERELAQQREEEAKQREEEAGRVLAAENERQARSAERRARLALKERRRKRREREEPALKRARTPANGPSRSADRLRRQKWQEQENPRPPPFVEAGYSERESAERRRLAAEQRADAAARERAAAVPNHHDRREVRIEEARAKRAAAAAAKEARARGAVRGGDTRPRNQADAFAAAHADPNRIAAVNAAADVPAPAPAAAPVPPRGGGGPVRKKRKSEAEKLRDDKAGWGKTPYNKHAGAMNNKRQTKQRTKKRDVSRTRNMSKKPVGAVFKTVLPR